MKLTVTKQFTFDAAHRLPDHEGLCKNLHGHRWTIEVTVGGYVNIKTGMIIDFGKLKEMLTPAIKAMDHAYLNDLPEIKQPPTAENISIYLVKYINERIPDAYILERVRVWETPNSYVEVTL